MGNIISNECGCGGQVPLVKGVFTIQPEPTPMRCCLPQFDPFRENRLVELHESTHTHPLMKERQISKSDAIDRDRSYHHMEDNMMWKVRSNGLPFEFCAPPWEELLPHVKASRSYMFQVEEVIREHMGTAGEAILRMGPDHPKRAFTSFAEMNTMFFKEPGQPGRGFPKVDARPLPWTSDEEFCRCRVSGPHSVYLRIITRKNQIPPNFEIKDEMLLGLMEQFDTMEEALTESRLYMVDYSEVLHVDTDDIVKLKMDPEEMEAIKHKSKRSNNEFICNPVALFFKNEKGDLTPLAIQLWGKTTVKFLEKNPINPVFTPCDNFYAWTLAKQYFNCADMHVHLIVSLCTFVFLLGAVMQLFMNRNLSMNHPLRQLLTPHLRMGTQGYDRAVQTLVGENGPMAQFLRFDSKAIKDVMARQWRKFDFNNKAFIHDILDRTDNTVLNGSSFIEDGRLWWEHINQYVRQVLSSYYTCPDDIDDDEELKGWIHEMSNNITRVMELHPARRDEPIAFNVTSIIFGNTAMFGALTHSAYDHYSNVGAFPGNIVVNEAIRKNRNNITLPDLIAVLPDKRSALIQIATAYVLSGKNDPVNPTTQFGAGVARTAFKDKRINATIQSFFTTKLDELQAKIDARNKKDGAYEYTNLNPCNVRNNYATVDSS